MIGLIDLGKKQKGKEFPNLALMKISAFHKSIGEDVKWYEPMDWQNDQKYSKVYVSKVFSFCDDYNYIINAEKVIFGGTGYYINRTLPKAIENCLPDYSIYPNVKHAIGFLTRGCINNCSFCVVPKKEGKMKICDSWQRIKRADSNEIVFMDNNVLASEYGIRQMQSMIGQDLKVDFNQGLDCMLVNERIADILASLKWISSIRFSLDKEYQMTYLEKSIKLLEGKGVKPYRIFVYVLGTTMESTYKRVEFLRNLGADPFVQPIIDLKSGTRNKDKELCTYANYVNKKAEFKSCSWKVYKYNIWGGNYDTKCKTKKEEQ